MKLRKKLKMRRTKRNWFKYGRKNMFTWVHRYLRLHSELLEDPIYQNMLNYHRDTLIAYFKRDVKNKNMSDAQYGEWIDALADNFNKKAAETVNEYKLLVDELYTFFKDDPNRKRDIRI